MAAVRVAAVLEEEGGALEAVMAKDGVAVEAAMAPQRPQRCSRPKPQKYHPNSGYPR